MGQVGYRIRELPAYRWAASGFLILLAAVFLQQGLALGRQYGYGSPGARDFIEYWGAGQLLRAGENPYAFDRLFAVQREQGLPAEAPICMWNPPWLLVWIFPALLLPFPAAAFTWLFANEAIVLVSVSLLWRTFARPASRRLVGIAWIASLLFAPTLFTLVLGQVSSLLLLGLAGFLYFEERRQDFVAGLFLALTTIKPHVVYLPWIAVAWWVLTTGRWKTLAGTAALLLPTVALLAFVWPAALAGYQTVLADPPRYATPTLGGILRALTGAEGLGTQFLVPSLVGLGLLGYLAASRRPLRWTAALGPLLLLSVATAPYGWSFDQLVLLVPCVQMLVWGIEDPTPGWRQKLTGAVALLLISCGMVAQHVRGQTDELLFWSPWAFAGVYLVAWRSQ